MFFKQWDAHLREHGGVSGRYVLLKNLEEQQHQQQENRQRDAIDDGEMREGGPAGAAVGQQGRGNFGGSAGM